ncbi:MAG: hypothetical protein U9O78_03440 [Patescibacteria group bacterium]|nr:hypothetical protein [Patescibacteria group bacterium]
MLENNNSDKARVPPQEYTEQTEREKAKVEALIAKYGKPKTVVHKKYEYGSDSTKGVLAEGCCNACAYEGEVQEGHFVCSTLSEDLREAEKEGFVNRVFQGNNWWVVLNSRFSDYYETEAPEPDGGEKR